MILSLVFVDVVIVVLAVTVRRKGEVMGVQGGATGSSTCELGRV